ncbi:MAG: NAD(P)/FAD-dependent oxidoreductase [Bacteroidia bacterium]|nr:NAD(P)/FAD-dependent oxidoreductase [Bacteroidia bacterium]
MPELVHLSLKPEEAADEKVIRKIAGELIKVNPSDISAVKIIKQSVDARQKIIKVNLSLEVFIGNESSAPSLEPFVTKNVSKQEEVIIVGAGPAGLFAALRLIELGMRPVIFERGKDVSARKIDIARISREQVVDPDSNYCFGEGGAGTYSDGKLYTRSKKRGDNIRVLQLLCLHGAKDNILYEAHPHLGTDKLPGIIRRIRESITDAGGQILLGKKVTDLLIEGSRINGIIASGNEKFLSSNVILATGHSARDITDICRKRGVNLEIKPFAMGVRVEHPQELIDRMQYHGNPRGEFLPAASYNFAKQVDGRGVYSFCMCPGGFIVPSATSQEEVVVNGMSPSQHSSPWANSGVVVEIRPEDLVKFNRFEELAGLEFQKEIEKEAWVNGGETQKAPAQRLADFVSGRSSSSLPEVSYLPGVTPSHLHEWLPESIGKKLREGLKLAGSAMKGYLTNEAVVLGVESRTSSPVRIPRDPDTMEHINISGLYPCGEGSGYSGGIVSSAVDGMRAAESVFFSIVKY